MLTRYSVTVVMSARDYKFAEMLTPSRLKDSEMPFGWVGAGCALAAGQQTGYIRLGVH